MGGGCICKSKIDKYCCASSDLVLFSGPNIKNSTKSNHIQNISEKNINRDPKISSDYNSCFNNNIKSDLIKFESPSNVDNLNQNIISNKVSKFSNKNLVPDNCNQIDTDNNAKKSLLEMQTRNGCYKFLYFQKWLET